MSEERWLLCLISIFASYREKAPNCVGTKSYFSDISGCLFQISFPRSTGSRYLTTIGILAIHSIVKVTTFDERTNQRRISITIRYTSDEYWQTTRDNCPPLDNEISPFHSTCISWLTGSWSGLQLEFLANILGGLHLCTRHFICHCINTRSVR